MAQLNAREIGTVIRISMVAAIIGTLLAICTVGALLIPLSGADFPSSGVAVHSQGPDQQNTHIEVKPESEQDEYMSSLVTDRAALYNGNASARLRQQAEVGESFPISMLVCAPSKAPCSSAPPTDSDRRPDSILPSDIRDLGSVSVGGRVQTELTWYGVGATVRALSPTEQVIAEPGDVAEWRWSVLVGKEPGRLHLQISVSSLRGDSNVSLFPTRFFDLDVEVMDTVRNRTDVIVSALNKFAVGAGTGIAALAGTIIAYLSYRRARGDRAATEGSGVDPVERQAGSFRALRKRRRRRKPDRG
ncbi:hypothetical protein [Micromonospora sp. WMMD964]|uniref:hypothetical protein n=1 Tax=Micromonospora sp. WMMD964 TaxID=3016091 RepID=UPI00249AA052|nr:hypothetical protein [Micromonospora sp. WMMD964]WFE99655.1 hypothetical protein O7616_22545 [Micromonospora sp. WMMD964]